MLKLCRHQFWHCLCFFCVVSYLKGLDNSVGQAPPRQFLVIAGLWKILALAASLFLHRTTLLEGKYWLLLFEEVQCNASNKEVHYQTGRPGLLLFDEVQHNFLTKKYNSDVEVQVFCLTALTIRQSSHYRGRKGRGSWKKKGQRNNLMKSEKVRLFMATFLVNMPRGNFQTKFKSDLIFKPQGSSSDQLPT